jgi:predicted transcriptional regulator
MNQMGTEMNQQNNNKIEWRRSKVRELLVKGFNHYEIANILHIPRPAITKDIQYLRQQDRENLQTHFQERLPQEYENYMAGINRVLQLTWKSAEKRIDDKTKLQALAQLNEGYKLKMDLTTNGVVITDAIKFVQTSKEELMSKKEDDKESEEPDYGEDKDQLEEKQEEETEELNKQDTTNQVF